jgi:hypothetical protein
MSEARLVLTAVIIEKRPVSETGLWSVAEPCTAQGTVRRIGAIMTCRERLAASVAPVARPGPRFP